MYKKKKTLRRENQPAAFGLWFALLSLFKNTENSSEVFFFLILLPSKISDIEFYPLSL